MPSTEHHHDCFCTHISAAVGQPATLAQQLAVMQVFKNKVDLICQIESGLGERF